MKIMRKTNIILVVIAIFMMVVFVSPETVSAKDPKEECKLYCENGFKIDSDEIEKLKLDIPKTYNINGYTVTITVTKIKKEDHKTEQIKFDWSSTLGICAVIVKGGKEGAEVYEYKPLAFSGKDLTTPTSQGISNIIFCYPEPECLPPNCEIEGDTEICEGEETILCANEIDGATYSWTGPGFTSSDTCVTVGVAGTYSVTITDECGESTCSVDLIVNDLPDCHITGDTEICDDETTTLCASDIAGASYSWTGPGVFTSGARCITVSVAGTYEVIITDECGESTCSVDLIVKHCEKRSCECSLVVLKRDEAGHPIDGAVFEVDGIEKTTSGGEARWDDLECDTTYEVRELSPIEQTERIHLGDCGERSTLRVVNKIEEGELEVLGIMEVLPFTGPAIPYSPFIGISTVLAGTFLYILSKPKKKR